MASHLTFRKQAKWDAKANVRKFLWLNFHILDRPSHFLGRDQWKWDANSNGVPFDFPKASEMGRES
ncbi:MAG: hypothetical protein ACO1OC_13070, partial [Tuberibacillus sp.]